MLLISGIKTQTCKEAAISRRYLSDNLLISIISQLGDRKGIWPVKKLLLKRHLCIG